MVGLLFSLAIYNGVTLPVSFPEVLYRKLLGGRAKCIHHIQDGWPVLSKGLLDLLQWADGDVEEVFARTYEFTFEVWDQNVHVNIQAPQQFDTASAPDVQTPWTKILKGTEDASYIRTSRGQCKASQEHHSANRNRHPSRLHSSEPREAAFVTNANREQYVEDYLDWLTDRSIRPQYEAFARGFLTCLDERSLTVYNAPVIFSIEQR